MANDLATLLQKEINDLQKQSEKHKLQYRYSQTAVLSLSGLASVISAWALMDGEPKKEALFAVVVVTALGTGLSAWVEMRRSRDLWQHERPIFHALRDLQREMEFLESLGELDVAKKKELFTRMSHLLSQSGKKWIKLVKDGDEDSKTSPSTSTDQTRP